MIRLSCGVSIWAEVSLTSSQMTHLTDGLHMARPRCTQCSAVIYGVYCTLRVIYVYNISASLFRQKQAVKKQPKVKRKQKNKYTAREIDTVTLRMHMAIGTI